ncbi:uncharacterized protein LOC120847578 [Ixodes scapularis]|uniref:uncharacterized protein LOC120847578 n=1 Tax=Ixodes scapularis TaxID=6945 RepID=UPI001C383730|nr:uncharacterized protein LOC120847578 [Ixodes scapularis]
MSSVGAGSAAAGRGNRNMASAEQDYQVILPTLPTIATILNTAFLHADVTMRPYRLERFRDALVGLALLPEVLALGAYQYNHVWAVTFKSVEGKKKLLAAGDFTVKEGRCVVVDPSNQDTRLKLHWLLHQVPDDEVRVALAPYGKVTEVARDVWRAQGCAGMLSTTRSVSIRLKAGLTVDSLPHQLRVAGDLALVVVPGRAPLCLRCRGKGHIRRECRVPRCALCRRFGHEDSQCIRTYASVTGPVGNEDTSELLMDVVESQEAAGGEGGEPPTEATPTGLSAGDRADGGNDGERRRHPEALPVDGTPASKGVTETAVSAVAATPSEESEAMSVGEAGSSGAVPKRAREDVDEGLILSAVLPEEPPRKATPTKAALVIRPFLTKSELVFVMTEDFATIY